VSAGILDGVRVLDLSDGIAGPIASMLLSDHGADVVITPGVGDDGVLDPTVWERGKRRIDVDLERDADRAAVVELASCADVVIESFRPGRAAQLGLDESALRAVNPALVHASITGYGRGTPCADRPPIEWLVAARTGLQWDQRGYFGTRADHIMGTDATTSPFEVPPGAEQTGCREGPIFLAVPWASIAAGLIALNGINAALLVRERTGRGQHVETSLVQGAILASAMGWQRVERPHPGYRLWYFDRRAPKGIFQAADGLWLHQFAPIDHRFLRSTAASVAGGGDALASAPPAGLVVGGGGYDDEVRFQAEAHPETAAAVSTLSRDEWIARCWSAGRAAQPILSPEEGLLDEPLEREGVIVELADPEHGPIRQVGHVYSLGAVPAPVIRPRRTTADAVSAIADEWADRRDRPCDLLDVVPPAPLAGVTVLDVGLAIAGPYGAQHLADLGATVIKVTTPGFDLTDAIYVGSSHGKQAIAVDLKHPDGREIARRLIATADVIHHNMRDGVAERLGIDVESARAANSRIIYCHTRGFERDGPRTGLPGNDQMAQALCGAAYDGGGTFHGTPPIWHMLGFGDTANGLLSATAVIQALLHRDRTGEGQCVDTSILNAAMLFTSYAYARPDGTGPVRVRVDAGQHGFGALQRLYETASGWLCVFVTGQEQWRAMARAIGREDLVADARFADAEARRAHDAELAAELAAVLATSDAPTWFERLDVAGVPCEIASSGFARELFDDPSMYERGWVIASEHRHLGHVEQVGMPLSFSLAAAQNRAGAPVTGQHTRDVLARLGYAPSEVADLIARGVVAAAE